MFVLRRRLFMLQQVWDCSVSYNHIIQLTIIVINNNFTWSAGANPSRHQRRAGSHLRQFLSSLRDHKYRKSLCTQQPFTLIFTPTASQEWTTNPILHVRSSGVPKNIQTIYCKTFLCSSMQQWQAGQLNILPQGGSRWLIKVRKRLTAVEESSCLSFFNSCQNISVVFY